MDKRVVLTEKRFISEEDYGKLAPFLREDVRNWLKEYIAYPILIEEFGYPDLTNIELMEVHVYSKHDCTLELYDENGARLVGEMTFSAGNHVWNMRLILKKPLIRAYTFNHGDAKPNSDDLRIVLNWVTLV